MKKNLLNPMSYRLPLMLAGAVLLPSIAQAHTGQGLASGAGHGFLHPIGGFDHVCAMLAVGLWAAQQGKRFVWAVPAAFVAVMAIGGIVGMAGLSVGFVEPGIVLSVLVLGALVAMAAKLPVWASASVVGFFAFFHGFAHGAEMVQGASGLAYSAGFLFATILLHAAGLGIGFGLDRLKQAPLVRIAGGVVALCGLYLLVG